MIHRLMDLVGSNTCHRVLGWLGVNLDEFHDWVEGICPCGVLNDADDEDDEELLAQ